MIQKRYKNIHNMIDYYSFTTRSPLVDDLYAHRPSAGLGRTPPIFHIRYSIFDIRFFEYDRHKEFSRGFQGIFSEFSLEVHHSCTLLLHHSLTTCAPFAHHLSTTCLPLVYHSFTTRAPFVDHSCAILYR